MLFNIKSAYILNHIFSLLDTKEKLTIIKYNKSLQTKLELDLEYFKKFSGRYLIIENNKFGKEFTLNENILVYIGGYKDGKKNGIGLEYNNLGILQYKGEFKKGKKNGKGKEYNKKLNNIIDKSFEGYYKDGKKNGLGRKYYGDGQLKFEGEYCNDIKEGLGKQFFKNGKLKFEGAYKQGKKWNGIGYDPNGNIAYELIEGKGLFKKFKFDFNILNLKFEGEYINGEKNGKGKEYDHNYLIFEGEYKNGVKNGKGKKYYYDKKVMFNGEYKEGKEWNGKGYDPEGKEVYEIKNGEGYIKLYTYNMRSYLYFEGELKEGKKNGKGIEYWKGKCTPIYKIFEGEFKNGEKSDGKLYHLNQLIYEGSFLNGEKWNGINNDLEHEICPDREIYSGQIMNGKKWKGIQKNIENHKKISEFEYINGKIDNVKGYHPKTGELIFEIKEGNGLMKYFQEEEGEYYKYFEVQLIDGEIKGIGKKYIKGSKLVFEGKYLNEKRNGKGKKYDQSGKLLFKGEFYNDYKNGAGKKYYLNGNIMFEGEYLHGHKMYGNFYNIKGEKECEIINGEGKIKEYDYNGNLIFEGEYKEGERWNGIIKEYNSNGKIIYENTLIKGKNEGKNISYNENGNIQQISEYKNGNMSGNVEKYYDDGKIKLEGNIFKGKVKEFYKNGKIQFEGEYFNLNREIGKEYDDKGNLVFDGKYEYGKRWEGTFREYDDNRNLIIEGEYLKGKIKLK